MILNAEHGGKALMRGHLPFRHMVVCDQGIHTRLIADVQDVYKVTFRLHLLHEALVLLNADDAQHFNFDARILFFKLGSDRFHRLDRSAFIPH